MSEVVEKQITGKARAEIFVKKVVEGNSNLLTDVIFELSFIGSNMRVMIT